MATAKSPKKSQSLRVALLCGGPSLEKGVSLNSARSICDHLHSPEIEVLPIYFDHQKKPFQISRSQLYCNTPSDFNFKLHSTAKPLSATAFQKFLKQTDIVFPAMHGTFGEDGQIQKLLSKSKVPFVGAPEIACKRAFDKYSANEFISANGFHTLPSTVLKSHLKDHQEVLTKFFQEHKITRAIVKPATGGSSISVFSVSSVAEALEKSHLIFSKRIDTRVVVEPFCEGTEFTVIILQNRFGLPVAVMPSEIEMNYQDHQIFDYRRKYLSNNQVRYHCPPRFADSIIEKIQVQAEQLFALLGMQDFARFDGWLTKDGQLWFSDFNPISGMEQNSFLFMQSARIGMSHRDTLLYILRNACRRHNISFPEIAPQTTKNQKPINVLFGGDTAERQVSIMSGTNVWLKLRNSQKYSPQPYLLDQDHNVWHLPYALTLNHTVEEITETCLTAQQDEARLHRLIERVQNKLSLNHRDFSEPWFNPQKMSLDEFINSSKYVFIGLHGGIGENGTLQQKLEKAQIPFNGSSSIGSKLCMNKYDTGQQLKDLESAGIYSAEKQIAKIADFQQFATTDFRKYWKGLTTELRCQSIIVKPIDDGCSAGIARLFGPKDLQVYLQHAQENLPLIPEGALKDQHGIIEMPSTPMTQVMFEQFIVTDNVRVVDGKIKWEVKTNWIEVTIGLVAVNGQLKALNPSMTIAGGNVLSLEEKFQGGTGVNITPPPAPFVKPKAIKNARMRMEKVANTLGVENYARIDAFMHTSTGELLVIEANSTPGLTPSTVIYHQALAETPALYPTDFLEHIVDESIAAAK